MSQPDSRETSASGADGDPMDTTDGHDDIPDWVAEAAEHLSACIDYRWNCHTEWCYVLPSDNPWGVHMIELAPAPLELTDRDDSPSAFRLGVEQFDLLAAQEHFEEVHEVLFRQPAGPAEVTIQGAIAGNPVRVTFYPAPPPQPPSR